MSVRALDEVERLCYSDACSSFCQNKYGMISPQAHLLLCALMVIVVMKFFRQGLYGLLASARTKRGWLSASTPLTTE